MKWFKHISDSLDDPFIFSLMNKHGADGYLVFFGTLEIYAREFQVKDGWNLSVTLPYLKQKFQKTHRQLITNTLQTISNSGKWEVTIVGDEVTIFIPKFKELMDESTLRKLSMIDKIIGTKSGKRPKKVVTDVDVDVDKDNTLTLFRVFWEAYPKKRNIAQAEKAWLKINPSQELFEYIMTKLSLLKKSKDWLKEGGQFIPYPATWLNAKGWDDEIDVQKKQDEADFL